MLRNVILILVAAFLATQTVLFALRYFLTGVAFVLVSRIHMLVVQQFVMAFVSFFTWSNLSCIAEELVFAFAPNHD